jgi:DNA/RNA endonuclease YhcR with UshA esterase domain
MNAKLFLISILALVAFVAIPLRAEDKPADKPDDKATSKPAETPKPEATLEASDTDALKAAKDKTVSVHGTISRIAASPSGSVTFINFQGVDRAGFTAIVKKASKEEALKGFGEDGADLQGKEVTITGPIILYKEKPEIEIKKADQIKLAAGDEKKDDKKEEPKDEKKPEDKKEEPKKERE